MNRERAKELLPIIQAFAEGKEIQVYNKIKGEWFDSSDIPSFSCGIDYRIKPEPKYVWLNIYGVGTSAFVFTSRSEADTNAKEGRIGRIKILIEDRFDE